MDAAEQREPRPIPAPPVVVPRDLPAPRDSAAAELQYGASARQLRSAARHTAIGWGVPLKDLSLFYHALGEMLRAGVSITRALDTTAATNANATVRNAILGMRATIEGGGTLAEAMASYPKIFPPLHAALITIAERSGRTDPVLRELADSTDRLISMRSTILSGLVLPMILMHVAAFVVPFPAFFIGGTIGGYLFSALGPLAMLWASLIGGTLIVRAALRSRSGAAVIDAIVRPIPILGRTWRELEYWRVTSGVQMLTNAGLGVIAALRDCADFCRSPKTAAALRLAADHAEAGVPVSASLGASGEFPSEMISLWATGEESGRLDEMLARSAQYFAERCQNRMRELARWLPRIAYGLVSIYLVMQIVKLFGQYVSLLNSVMQ